MPYYFPDYLKCQLKMDLQFLKTLQSMAEVEREDPHFRSKKYVIVDNASRTVVASQGTTPVVLKHPELVIVVASPTGKAPPPALGEMRVDKLSEAIKMALIAGKQFGRKGASIVVHEGLYVDATIPFRFSSLIFGWEEMRFSLEIVGLGEVRILNFTKSSFTKNLGLFNVIGFELTMKNLLIYDRQIGRESTDSCFIFALDAKVTLVDVCVHGFEAHSRSRKTESDFYECTFVDCNTLSLMEYSKARFDKCTWVRCNDTMVHAKSQLSISNSDVKGVTRYTVYGLASFLKCGLARVHITVSSGGQLLMNSCQLGQNQIPVFVSDANSKAVLQKTEIFDCDSAIAAILNSSVTATECTFRKMDFVLKLHKNSSGKVVFRRNTVNQNYSGAPVVLENETAAMSTDSDWNVVDHDFRKVHKVIDSMEDDFLVQLYKNSEIGGTKESRSKALQKLSKHFTDLDREDTSWLSNHNTCRHCRKKASHYPELKFKYCMRCRYVSYCSKECQLANWGDHKLVCEKRSS